MGFDGNGFAWTLGLGSDRVFMLDPETNRRAAALPDGASIGGGSHYTYSDFTGSTALSFTAPNSIWRYTFDSSYGNAQVDLIEWEAHVPEGTSAGIRIQALDEEGSPVSEWAPAPVGPTPDYAEYPTGADSHVFDLSAIDLVGREFVIEVRMETSDPDVQPIVHAVRLLWQRP